MKRIILKQLILINFKGVKKLIIDFSQETDIFGENSTFKTTIFDAYCWLPFGKDSSGRSDFNIKTLDENNKPIHNLEHEVQAVIFEDDHQVVLKRVFREKWVKKRGEAESTFNGHETAYFVNDVPLSMSDYQAKVNSIVDENLFKLITSPLAFNGEFKSKLPDWTIRRNILFNLAGTITNEDIAKGNKNFEDLLKLVGVENIIDYQKGIAAKRKKLNDELKEIPTRIDELDRNTPEPLDFDSIEKQIKDHEAHLQKIDDQLEDSNKAFDAVAQEIQDKQTKIMDLQKNINVLIFEAQTSKDKGKSEQESEKNKLVIRITNLEEEMEGYQVKVSKLKNFVINNERELGDLRNRWTVENSKQLIFNENEFSCPACKRPFEADDIEAKKAEMTANFNVDKTKRLEVISDQGKQLKNESEASKQQISDYEKAIKECESLIVENQAKLKLFEKTEEKESVTQKTGEQVKIETEIEEIKKTIPEKPVVDNEALKQNKNELQLTLNELKIFLMRRDQIKTSKIRKEELERQQKELSQQIADIEKIEFTIEKFTKAKIEAVEERINSKFKHARFKMYESQINEGERETCITLYKGVPWNDLNHGAKIFVGIDIINTLCEHYQVSAPIFIDNRESIIRIPETKSQLINLIVSEKDKKLKIQNKKSVEKTELAEVV